MKWPPSGCKKELAEFKLEIGDCEAFNIHHPCIHSEAVHVEHQLSRISRWEKYCSEGRVVTPIIPMIYDMAVTQRNNAVSLIPRNY
jgi:hypothetical protein